MFSDQPLAAFNLFRSRDADQAREIVASKFCDHHLDPVGSDTTLDVVQNRVRGDAVSLNYLRYGADVRIEPGDLGDFYLIQIPLRGHADIVNGHQEVAASPLCASILNPDLSTRMVWHAGCEKAMLQIDAGRLRQTAENAIGHEVTKLPRFETLLDFRRAETRRWLARVSACFRSAETGHLFSPHTGLSQRLIEEQLILGLLQMQPGTLRHFFESDHVDAGPRCFRRAKDYIHAHVDDAITCTDIAEAAGTSVRNLQYVFRRLAGCGPVAYLNGERLKLAHLKLMEDGHSKTVTEIANGLGFTHLGRFSVAYRERFGQSPRQTAKRAH